MDRCAAFEAGSSALNAARPLGEAKITPLRLIEPAGLQDIRRIAHRGLARIANDAHQALGRNAVERRDEVVRVHAHIHDSPQHVYYVVSVYRVANQVTGECRLDSDLPCL